MDNFIAACGLDCSKCEAYLATQANDLEAMEKIAAKWRKEFASPQITVDAVTCDGCLVGKRHGGYCAECGIRKCVQEHALPNCAHCADYPCEDLKNFFEMAPQARSCLDSIRTQL